MFDLYRAADPLHWGKPLQPGLPGAWYLTRYDDVVSLLRSDRVGHARPRRTQAAEPDFQGDGFTLDDVLDRWFVFMDGSEHVRIRSVLGKPLKALASASTRAHLTKVSRDLIDGFPAAGAIDLVPLYNYPFPVIAIAHMMGFPESDHPRLIRWARRFIQVFDLRSEEVIREARATFAEFFDYVRGHVAERRAEPRDDLLAVLMRAADDGTITFNELLCTAALLLLAGAETTPTLIGNAIWLLLTYPEARDALLADLNRAESAIDEVMRFESPVQISGRHALADFDLRGKTIKKGDYVVALFGAANRDPQQFPDPHRFDIARTPNRHLGFGVGAHACVGGSLGHLIGQVAIQTLFERWPRMNLNTPKADWNGHGSIRGLRSLIVEAAG